jgi:hypothetical protein
MSAIGNNNSISSHPFARTNRVGGLAANANTTTTTAPVQQRADQFGGGQQYFDAPQAQQNWNSSGGVGAGFTQGQQGPNGATGGVNATGAAAPVEKVCLFKAYEIENILEQAVDTNKLRKFYPPGSLAVISAEIASKDMSEFLADGLTKDDMKKIIPTALYDIKVVRNESAGAATATERLSAGIHYLDTDGAQYLPANRSPSTTIEGDLRGVRAKAPVLKKPIAYIIIDDFKSGQSTYTSAFEQTHKSVKDKNNCNTQHAVRYMGVQLGDDAAASKFLKKTDKKPTFGDGVGNVFDTVKAEGSGLTPAKFMIKVLGIGLKTND